MSPSQSYRKSSEHAMKHFLSQVFRQSLQCQHRRRCSDHSCRVDPGSSLVRVCQRSTFFPLFFRQSIQCCRVSPCEWHPKDTPPIPEQTGRETWVKLQKGGNLCKTKRTFRMSIFINLVGCRTWKESECNSLQLQPPPSLSIENNWNFGFLCT